MPLQYQEAGFQLYHHLPIAVPGATRTGTGSSSSPASLWSHVQSPSPSGRCLVGGGGPCLLCCTLQQCELLRQIGVGLHHHVMLNLLPNPHFQALLQLLLLHDARLLGSDDSTAFPRPSAPLRSRRLAFRFLRLELALSLRHVVPRAGRGGATCRRAGTRVTSLSTVGP